MSYKVDLDFKRNLLRKLQDVSDLTADELDIRVQTLPAKELVALLSTSVQLQSVLEREINEAEASQSETDPNRIVEAKYQNLGVSKSQVVNLLQM